LVLKERKWPKQDFQATSLNLEISDTYS